MFPYQLDYMEIPGRRKHRTIAQLSHCKSIFDGIEKFFCKSPKSTKELKVVNGISIRYYESRVNIRQQIPTMRFRLQVNFHKRKILVDQLAVYDLEMHELYLDID